MLNAIAPGTVVSPTNPVLDIWTQRTVTDSTGFQFFGLGAPYSLEFAIWSLANPDAPVQVFPATSGTWQAVDLTADRVAATEGHYAARCTLPATSGRHQVRWRVLDVVGGESVTVLRDFDLLAAAAAVSEAGRGYALVSELREEGITAADASDARLLRQIGLASQYVERVTGRCFRPVKKTIQTAGSGGRLVTLGEPVIALVGVSLGQPPTTYVDRTSLRVNNRHLASGLLTPDDRNNPAVEFTHFSDTAIGRRGDAMVASPLFGVPWRDHYFPRGVQNVTVSGVFGYTDPDGSGTGRTPALIEHATRLIVARDLPKIAGCEDRDGLRSRHRITGETTRDQSYTRANDIETAFTGEREIDDILLMFMRPMGLGSA